MVLKPSDPILNVDVNPTSNHKESPPSKINSGSSPSLQPPPTRELQRALIGYRVLIKRGTKRVNLFRFLVSKMIYDDEGIHLDEFLIIHDLYYHLIESRDPNLSELSIRLQSPLVSEFFKKFRKNTIFPYQPWVSTRSVMESLCLEIIYHKRSFFRIKGQNMNKSFRLILSDTLIPKKPKAKAYIGIGYKDKGSRRKVYEDGSPSWQEVGTHFANQERIAEEIPGTSSELSEAET